MYDVKTKIKTIQSYVIQYSIKISGICAAKWKCWNLIKSRWKWWLFIVSEGTAFMEMKTCQNSEVDWFPQCLINTSTIMHYVKCSINKLDGSSEIWQYIWSHFTSIFDNHSLGYMIRCKTLTFYLLKDCSI